MEKETCKYCGKVLEKGEEYEFEGTIMCKSCFDSWTSVCTHCGTRIWNDENSGSDNFVLCPTCFDNHYTICERCGRVLHFDDARYFYDNDEPYCATCFDIESREEIIHDYGYKPEPIFYGDDDMYLGVELEVDCGGENSNNAENLLYIANNSSTHMYIKHDGSIEDGFEMVTHPMALEYHQNNMPWKTIFN